MREIGETITFYTPDGIRGVFTNGKQLTVTGNRGQAEQFNVNPIKKAYSTEVVRATAKKYGWQIKQTAENKFAVQKAGF